jgi:hypothetical protein
MNPGRKSEASAQIRILDRRGLWLIFEKIFGIFAKLNRIFPEILVTPQGFNQASQYQDRLILFRKGRNFLE